jgi:ribosomal protein L11 methyltransferase
MSLSGRWLVLTAHASTTDPLRELIGEGLLALGGCAVLEEGDELTTYLAPPDDPRDFLEYASRFLGEWIADEPPPLSWRWQANEEWEREWRRGLAPRKVSSRIVVKPSWTGWQAAPHEVVLVIDPQMAFGTGEHATTRGCLRLLDRHLRGGDRVLDVGSGSAILAIAAAKLGAGSVIAVEYDPDANLNARENLERNGVAGTVELREAMADPRLIAELGRFDFILANILSGVVRPLFSPLHDALGDDGRLVVSGILVRERDEVVESAASADLALLAEEAEEGWWSGMFGRSVRAPDLGSRAGRRSGP